MYKSCSEKGGRRAGPRYILEATPGCSWDPLLFQATPAWMGSLPWLRGVHHTYCGTGWYLFLSPPPAYLPLSQAQAPLCSFTVLKVLKSLTKLGVAWARLDESCHIFLPARPRLLLVSNSLTSPKPQQSPYHRATAIVIRFCLWVKMTQASFPFPLP